MSAAQENHFSLIKCKTTHIGHASTSNPSSGLAADEVLISNFYDDIEHNIVLRPKTRDLAEWSAVACEAACSNDNIEYSQDYRDTLYNKALETTPNYDLGVINTKCYADCSSFMTVCAIAGGANITYGSSAPRCDTMKEVFKASGDYDILLVEDNANLKNPAYLIRGDILVRDWFKNGSRHTVMVLDTGEAIPESIISVRDTSWINDFFAIRVAVSIKSISQKNASVLASITKIHEGKEIALSDKAILDLYDWTWTLEAISNTGIQPITTALTVDKSETDINLSGLRPETTYTLVVKAKEKSSEVEFNSPTIIFTTARDFELNTEQIDFVSVGSSKNNCKTFIKIDDHFNNTIVYNRREV